MAKYPALPLFTDAYLADTRHLTTLQHGAYLLLLMTAWRSPDCSLPDDEKLLARYAGLDLRTWRSNSEVVLGFWELDEEHRWRQRRLIDERKHADDVRSKNSSSGKASALKRHERHSTTVQPKRNIKATNPTHIDSEAKASSSPPPPLPDWMPIDAWNGYLAMRKKKRASPTPEAIVLIIAKLDSWRAKGHDPTEILSKSITSNWTDIYEPKENRHDNTARRHHDQPNKDDRAKAAVMRAAERLGFAPVG